jgi:hypothetical protein
VQEAELTKDFSSMISLHFLDILELASARGNRCSALTIAYDEELVGLVALVDDNFPRLVSTLRHYVGELRNIFITERLKYFHFPQSGVCSLPGISYIADN